MRRSIAMVIGLASAFMSCSRDQLSEPPQPEAVVNRLTATYARHFVSTTGRSTGIGDSLHPWSLQHALKGANGGIGAGDTIFVRGGVYTGDPATPGRYVASVNVGTPSARVVFRELPSEDVILEDNRIGDIQSQFSVAGANLVFWGFEFRNVYLDQGRKQHRPDVVYNKRSNNTYLNLTIHDGGVAFYNEDTARGVTVRGSVIYNNGWQNTDTTDRGHGHGLYIRSNSGPVRLESNLIFNQFGYGLHANSDVAGQNVVGIYSNHNVFFNNGTNAMPYGSANILFGGSQFANNDSISWTIAYMSPGVRTTNVRAGSGTTENGRLDIYASYFVGGTPVLEVGYWNTAQTWIEGNGLAVWDVSPSSTDLLVSLQRGYSWVDQSYWGDSLAKSWKYLGTAYDWPNFRIQSGITGFDNPPVAAAPNASGFSDCTYTDAETFSGTCLLTLINSGNQQTFTFNPSGVIPIGSNYKIWNAQNLMGAPIKNTTYSGGNIILNITAVIPPAPIGLSMSRSPNTGTAFVAYLVKFTP